jgi:hypothetical protein
LIEARRRPIDLGRALHVQGFVRTFLVEDFDEVTEPSLRLEGSFERQARLRRQFGVVKDIDAPYFTTPTLMVTLLQSNSELAKETKCGG